MQLTLHPNPKDREEGHAVKCPQIPEMHVIGGRTRMSRPASGQSLGKTSLGPRGPPEASHLLFLSPGASSPLTSASPAAGRQLAISTGAQVGPGAEALATGVPADSWHGQSR